MIGMSITRVVGYVRVSQEGGRGQDLVSPQIQQDSIERYCVDNDLELVEVLVDINKTGRVWDSRQIDDAVRRIESREIDGVVTWKLSRVCRSKRDFYRAKDRVRSVGGFILSATEPNDQSAAGDFTEGIFVNLAEFESNIIGEGWTDVHKLRRKNGLPHTGPQRPGYRYVPRKGTDKTIPDRGIYVIDVDEAPVIRELHRRYLAGTNLGALAIWLRGEGITGSRGRPWGKDGVRDYLAGGFAAGYLSVHDPDCKKLRDGIMTICGNPGGSCHNRIQVLGAHDAIIDELTYRLAVAEIARRAQAAPKSRIPKNRLSGLVICAGCGGVMNTQSSNQEPQVYYKCRSRRSTTRVCTQPALVRRLAVEEAVYSWLRTDAMEELTSATVAAPDAATDTSAQRSRILQLLADLDRRESRLMDDDMAGRYRREVIDVKLGELHTDRQMLQAELERLPRPEALAGHQDTVATVLQVWNDAEPHQVAALLRNIIRVDITKPNHISIRWIL